MHRLLTCLLLVAMGLAGGCAAGRQPSCSAPAVPVNANGIHPDEVDRHGA